MTSIIGAGKYVKKVLKYNYTTGLYSFVDFLKEYLQISEEGDDIKKQEECKKKILEIIDNIPQ